MYIVHTLTWINTPVISPLGTIMNWSQNVGTLEMVSHAERHINQCLTFHKKKTVAYTSSHLVQGIMSLWKYWCMQYFSPKICMQGRGKIRFQKKTCKDMENMHDMHDIHCMSIKKNKQEWVIDKTCFLPSFPAFTEK